MSEFVGLWEIPSEVACEGTARGVSKQLKIELSDDQKNLMIYALDSKGENFNKLLSTQAETFETKNILGYKEKITTAPRLIEMSEGQRIFSVGLLADQIEPTTQARGRSTLKWDIYNLISYTFNLLSADQLLVMFLRTNNSTLSINDKVLNPPTDKSDGLRCWYSRKK